MKHYLPAGAERDGDVLLAAALRGVAEQGRVEGEVDLALRDAAVRVEEGAWVEPLDLHLEDLVLRHLQFVITLS